MKKVVIIGGGTGLSYLLKSFKLLEIDLTVGVAISDNGGSTGKIRDYYQIPAPGDLRRAVVALSQEKNIEQLMNYRFDKQIDNHTIGNLILAALIDIHGNINEAVKHYRRILNVKDRIYPISVQSLHLQAIMEDNSIIVGERQIVKSDQEIKRVFYGEEARANVKIVQAILEADFVILSSGSLFSSILANLVFDEMIDALQKTTAKIVYVSNLMTEKGETTDYSLSKHLLKINEHVGFDLVDYVFANVDYEIELNLKNKYEQEGSKIVELDEENMAKYLKAHIIKGNYIKISDDGHIRHDSTKILVEFLKLLEL